jgi:hypothetical protein
VQLIFVEGYRNLFGTTQEVYEMRLISIIAIVLAGQLIVLSQTPERALEGAWVAKVTPKNCVTGDPIPAAAFEALLTFNQGGTTLMSVKGNTNIANVVRTPFHGIWRKDHGWSEYTFKVMHIRSNATTMEFIGLQETGGTITLGESGDDYTANTYTVVYSIDGVPGTGGCSTTVGKRIKFNQ